MTATTESRSVSGVAKHKNTEALNAMDLKYIVRRGGEHLLVFVGSTKLNFWPSSGQWSEYGEFTNKHEGGFFEHVKGLLDGQRKPRLGPVTAKDVEENQSQENDEKDRATLTAMADAMAKEIEGCEQRIKRLRGDEQAIRRAIRDLYEGE
jgi:hypothetical protein